MASTQLYRLGSDGLIHQPGARRSAKTSGLWTPGQYEPHLAGLFTPFADVGPRVKRSDCTVVTTDPFPVTNGSVYSKIDFRGRLSFPAITTGALFVDCFGTGAYPTTGDGGIFDARAGAGVDNMRWEFLHCLARPDSPNAWTNGAIGHHFRFFNCLFRDVVDGVGSYNTNGPKTQNETYGCYFDRSLWWSPDPTGDHTDTTHNDTGAQHQGGDGFWFVGNAVHGYVKDRSGNIKTLPNPNGSAPNYNQSGQGVIVQQNVEASSDIHINYNWFYGCGRPRQRRSCRQPVDGLRREGLRRLPALLLVPVRRRLLRQRRLLRRRQQPAALTRGRRQPVGRRRHQQLQHGRRR
jgi:hypothetical protein